MKDFLDFLNGTPTPCQVLSELENELLNAGGKEITLSEIKSASREGYYYINFADSCLAAFYIGKKAKTLKIGAAHTDYPVLKVKTVGLRGGSGLLRMNVEAYGGLIHHSWLDRPLKLAGRVYYNDGSGIGFRDTADLGPRFIIPDAAIHLNRQINDGAKYSVQNQLLPIFGADNGNPDALCELIGAKLGISKESILSFDLSLVTAEPAGFAGAADEFTVAQGLDDRAMIYSLFSGFLAASPSDDAISVAFAFNNEECGSQTIGGARSVFVSELVKTLAESFCGGHYLDVCRQSIVLSADMAHGVHPSYPDLGDSASPVYLGKGIALKSSANQTYVSEGSSKAYFVKLCRDNNIPFQIYYNNSDIRGGSTIGPMLAAELGIPVCDIGTPTLAMHAAAEVESCEDQRTADLLFEKFFG